MDLTVMQEPYKLATEEIAISKSRRIWLALSIFQLLHKVRPYNAFNHALLEDALDSEILKRYINAKELKPIPFSNHSPDRVKEKAEPFNRPKEFQPLRDFQNEKKDKEKFKASSLLSLLKLILWAKADMLQKICIVLERDYQTIERLTKNQAKRIKRMDLAGKDHDARLSHMEKLINLRTVQILELHDRVNAVQNVSNDGTFIWCIDNINTRMNDAKGSKQMSVYSPPFYNLRYGYRICLRLYLNGDGMGKGSHVSLFMVIMRSNYDAIQNWPFKQKITFLLYDQGFKAHVIDAFRPDYQNPSFKRPVNNMNIASGSSLFVPLCMLEPDSTGNAYIKDDCMFIKIIIDCSELV